MKTNSIARVCYEASKAYCEANGDYSHVSWDEAAGSTTGGLVKAIQFYIQNPSAGAARVHDILVKEMLEAGWRSGPRMSHLKKEDPFLVPFSELSRIQKVRNRIIFSIAHECLQVLDQGKKE